MLDSMFTFRLAFRPLQVVEAVEVNDTDRRLDMTVGQLLEALQDIAEEHGNDVEVRLAHQPQWPFEYSIAEVVLVGADERELKPGDRVKNLLRGRQRGVIDRLEGDDAAYVHWDEGSEQLCLLTDLRALPSEDDEDAAEETVVYIAEQRQLGYLSGAASKALGWR
jgi:hypothetical protein